MYCKSLLHGVAWPPFSYLYHFQHVGVRTSPQNWRYTVQAAINVLMSIRKSYGKPCHLLETREGHWYVMKHPMDIHQRKNY